MFKKFSSIVAALSVVFAGLTATSASATDYTPNPESNIVGASWSGQIPGNGAMTVPVNAKRISLTKQWKWEGASLPDVEGKTVTFDWSLTLPNNTVVNAANASSSGFSAYSSGNLNGQGTYAYVDSAPQSTDLEMTGTQGATYSQASVYFDLYSYNNIVLSSGTYTVNLTLKIDGVVYTNFTTSGADNAYVERNEYYVTGASGLNTAMTVEYLGLDKVTIESATCINTSLLEENDVLTIRRLVDGAEVPVQTPGVSRSMNLGHLVVDYQNWPYLNTNGNIFTYTLTQNDITRGLKLESDLQFIDTASSNPSLTVNNGLSAGSHTFEISVVDQDGVEVTSGCTPPVPATPTVTINGTNVSAVATGTFSESNIATYTCQAYKASDNTTLGSPSYGSTSNYNNGSYGTLTCSSFTGITGGTQFYVKVVATSGISSAWKSLSSASNTVTMPSSGVTISTTHQMARHSVT